MVDDFGVKYVVEKHALRIKQIFKEDYEVTTEWDGTRYIRITLDWYYRLIHVHLSLPGYTEKFLK